MSLEPPPPPPAGHKSYTRGFPCESRDADRASETALLRIYACIQSEMVATTAAATTATTTPPANDHDAFCTTPRFHTRTHARIYTTLAHRACACSCFRVCVPVCVCVCAMFSRWLAAYVYSCPLLYMAAYPHAHTCTHAHARVIYTPPCRRGATSFVGGRGEGGCAYTELENNHIARTNTYVYTTPDTRTRTRTSERKGKKNIHTHSSCTF